MQKERGTPMKIMPTLRLVPGMIVAEDVLTPDNHYILQKGTRLTDALITKLDLYGILSVAIERTEESQPWIDTEKSYSERIKKTPEFKAFQENYLAEVDSLRNNLNSVIVKNAPLDVQSLINDALQMVTNFKGCISIFDILQNMREYDDSTFSHCMNVGLICYIFAGWLRWSKEDAELATACGLLHDVGKLLISQDILKKPGKLTKEEFEEMKKHPAIGYHLLLEKNVDENIYYSALMHHERCDGGGYPSGLYGPKINRFAKLVAIADVYDAMTSARVYRGPMCPFKAIEIFEDEGYQKYDVHYILTFLENIVNTYIPNPCRLSDGREATIIFINKRKLSRPTVKCGNTYIDLSQTPDLYIECLL